MQEEQKKGNDHIIIGTAVASIIAISYSLYTTLFILDGSAQDFIALTGIFWANNIMNMWLPFGMLLFVLARALHKKNATLGTLLYCFVGFQFLSLFVLPIAFSLAGGVGVLVAFATTLARKIYQAFHDSLSTVVQFATTFIGSFIALAGAALLDYMLRLNPLYLSVLSDTMEHMPGQMDYSASPPLTVNAHALMAFLFVIITTVLDLILIPLAIRYVEKSKLMKEEWKKKNATLSESTITAQTPYS